MSVRKRKWVTRKGDEREAWIVDYVDRNGARCIETFAKKKEADERETAINGDKIAGTFVAPRKSITVKQAGESWIKAAEAAKLERATIAQYRQHLDLHIGPFIGTVKLSDLNAAGVRLFADQLRKAEQPRSPALIRKIIVSLGSLFADAQEQGLAARNPVRDLHRGQQRGKKRRVERRQRGKLKAGVDIPLPAEIAAIVANLKGRWRPLIMTVIFTGLRASELRGLRWGDVDLKGSKLHVRQRADRYNKIGPPKSEAAEREVPLPPLVVNTLKEWKLGCPKGELDLVFPNGAGNVESLANLINRGLIPPQIAAGVTLPVTDDAGKALLDEKGKPIVKAKYTGLHALRHFYASWCINRREDGGLGLLPKRVQERLGHSSIVMTMDRYGHLFPTGDDSAELAEAERALLA